MKSCKINQEISQKYMDLCEMCTYKKVARKLKFDLIYIILVSLGPLINFLLVEMYF